MRKDTHKRNYQFLTMIALFCLGISFVINLLTNISLDQTALYIAVASFLFAIASIEYTRHSIKESKKGK